MIYLKRKKCINLLLVLILFLAPVETLFAQIVHNLKEANSSPSVHLSLDSDTNHCQFMMGGMDHNQSHKVIYFQNLDGTTEKLAARIGASHAIKENDSLDFYINLNQLHLFNASTGERFSDRVFSELA